jgi:hypothetical protein
MSRSAQPRAYSSAEDRLPTGGVDELDRVIIDDGITDEQRAVFAEHDVEVVVVDTAAGRETQSPPQIRKGSR